VPPLEAMDRYQDAVLWPAAGEDRYGEALVGDPVPLKVRWHTARRTMRGPDGDPVSVDATAVVDRAVEVGSLMWLGSVGDLPPGTDWREEIAEAMTVVAYEETVDLKGRTRHTYRDVGLARTKDAAAEAAGDEP
jgi:hypothetical protein